MRANDQTTLRKLKAQAEARRRADDEWEDQQEAQHASAPRGVTKPGVTKPGVAKPGVAPGGAGMGARGADAEYYMYTLSVHPSLFGQLRIRCWAAGGHMHTCMHAVVERAALYLMLGGR